MKQWLKYILIFLGLICFSSCRDKELDMTVMRQTLYEDAVITAVTAEDAWNVTIVQDDNRTFVELEYSAFLEEYLQVRMDGQELKIGFSSHLNLPGNTVMSATIHTASVQKLCFAEAVTAVLEGDFPATALAMELKDASTCKGGHFTGRAELTLKDASTMVDFTFDGLSCILEAEDAAVFKGVLNIGESLNIKITEASRMTTYGGYAPRADVEVSDASSLNMLETEVEWMNITVKDSSEASVFVTGTLEGSVKSASVLYYQGNPIVNVDCDDSSTVQPLSTFKHQLSTFN